MRGRDRCRYYGDADTVIDDDRLFDAIGRRLRAIRKSNKHTQSTMADILGLERTSVTNIELGKQRPGLHVLYRCCEHFEIPIIDLLPPIVSVLKKELPPAAAAALEKVRASRR